MHKNIKTITINATAENPALPPIRLVIGRTGEAERYVGDMRVNPDTFRDVLALVAERAYEVSAS